MTEDVVTRRNRLGDFNHPAVVVLDQLVVTPCTGYLRVVDEPDAIDFEELQLGLVHGLTAVTAVC